jgi:dTDP-4-amino-4,6-dideoxygalactose transaminase
MDAIQAAILRVKAPHLAAWTNARRENATRYSVLFREAGLKDLITLPAEPPGYRHIFNQFVIRTARRDDLRAHLRERGIGTEVYYPLPLHLQPCFDYLGKRRGDFPVAEAAAAESLALPIYGELGPAKQQAVVGAIAQFIHTAETPRGSVHA